MYLNLASAHFKNRGNNPDLLRILKAIDEKSLNLGHCQTVVEIFLNEQNLHPKNDDVQNYLFALVYFKAKLEEKSLDPLAIIQDSFPPFDSHAQKRQARVFEDVIQKIKDLGLDL